MVNVGSLGLIEARKVSGLTQLVSTSSLQVISGAIFCLAADLIGLRLPAGHQDPLCFIAGGPGQHSGVRCDWTSKLLLVSRLDWTTGMVTSLSRVMWVDWSLMYTSVLDLTILSSW